MNNMKPFQALIKQVIDEKRVSRGDLSKLFGASLPTVQRWYSGENEPAPAMAALITKQLKKLINVP